MEFKSTVISEEYTDKAKITVFRMPCGTTVRMTEPFHTKEEQDKINQNFLMACARIVYPDVDLSKVKKITMICD